MTQLRLGTRPEPQKATAGRPTARRVWGVCITRRNLGRCRLSRGTPTSRPGAYSPGGSALQVGPRGTPASC
eukprot:3927370-Prymnesium_polylepis.2